MGSNRRMANQRIEELINYIQTPHSAREQITRDDPYFYGMSEQYWKETQDILHRDINDPNYPNGKIHRELTRNWGITPGEASTIVDHSKYGKEARHVNKGVPHAWTTEEVARQALLGSGHQANRINSSSHIATDLEAMIGSLNKYIDVQMNYTPGGIGNRVIIPVMNSMPYGTAQQVRMASGPNSALNQVILNANQITGGKWNRDKLMQSKRSQASKLKPPSNDKVKDMLMIGNYDIDKVNNLAMRPMQGHYNPSAPRDLSLVDLDVIRQQVLGMSSRDIRKELGGELRFFNDPMRTGGNKIKLELPMKAIQQLGAQNTDVLDPQVIYELNRLSL